jgi:peptide-methionine (S)-S-oxide reductase
MKLSIVTGSVVLISLFLIFLIPGENNIFAAVPQPPEEQGTMEVGGTETAVLAGGCFWGMEGVFERLKGVLDVISGYSGGESETAHYEMVGTGTTGHAESIRITYNPSVISFGTLLKVFFFIAHDPTALNRQGPDTGTQYRSVVFYTNGEQRRITEEYIRIIDEADVFPHPVVTRVMPFHAFYPAEEYHQDFMKRNPDYPYIVFWDIPKVKKLEAAFPELVVQP